MGVISFFFSILKGCMGVIYGYMGLFRVIWGLFHFLAFYRGIWGLYRVK